MILVSQSYEILTPIDGDRILKSIERAGRTCYKSEDKITEHSAKKFVAMILARGHESVIEHESISVKFTTDRGVSHEIVRHRLASYSQESTRYCRYEGEIQVIGPPGLNEETREVWLQAIGVAQGAYQRLLDYGVTPEIARSVLPNALKTEIVMTANLREWRHFFKLRTANAAHPQMRQLTRPLLAELQERIPVIFDGVGDIEK